MKPLEYLSTRVEEVVVQSDKIYNKGAWLLASYEDWRILLPELVNNAQHIITQHCIRGRGTAAKLTYTSYSIGQAVMRTLGWEEDPYKALALGDIFLEAF